MRDPPDSASVSEAHICRSDTLSVRRAEVGLAPRRIRVQTLYDDLSPVDGPATESFAQRLATVLCRALAAWPA